MTTALKRRSARQGVVWAYIDVLLANHATGVDLKCIEVPEGAIVVDGFVDLTAVFNSTTSDVLDVGDEDTENLYKNDIDVHTGASLVSTSIVRTGKVYTKPTKITTRWVSGGGVPTTGSYTLAIAYMVKGRADLGPQGLDSSA